MEIIGSSGNDTLSGTMDADTLRGGAGNDLLTGGVGDDWLVGGPGDDTLDGGIDAPRGDVADYRDSDALRVDLQAGTAFSNAAGFDQLIGIEVIYAAGGNDTLLGSIYAEQFHPGAGDDSIDGRNGFDTVYYDTATSGMTVDLLAGRASGGGMGFDTLHGVQNIVGSDHADTVRLSNVHFGWAAGGAGNDTLTGGTGDDSLWGGSGADSLAGGNGDDTLNGGSGLDLISGGAGYDLYSYELLEGDSAGAVGVVVDLGSSVGQGSWGEIEMLVGIEGVTGSQLGDRLVGDTGANWLDGSGGNDTLVGGFGNDTLVGGPGVDTAVYSRNLAQYEVDFQLSFVRVASDIYNDQEDITVGVERLVFSDVNLAVDLEGSAGLVAKIFALVFGEGSLFNPQAVKVGLGIADNSGLSDEQLMQMALDIRLGPGASNEAVVDLMYTNVFGHAPAPEAREYYLEWILDGRTHAQFGVHCAELLGIPEAARNGIIFAD